MNRPYLVGEWRLRAAMTLAVVVPLLVALLLAWYASAQRPEAPQPLVLTPAASISTSQVDALFARYDYLWPPVTGVPAIAVKRLPPGMGDLPVEQRKSLFFRMLLPLVVVENQRLQAEREWLQALHADGAYAASQQLKSLAAEYRLDPSLPSDELLESLLQRVDVVPVALVLAQAANESGWGTSRFSREANNLFGEWTYQAELGLLPQRRPQGATHYVRRFDTLRDSLRSYLHNLNSGKAYESFRRIRAEMRVQGQELEPLRLAEGLLRYSARGGDYVREIQLMIRNNGLNTLGPLDLRR